MTRPEPFGTGPDGSVIWAVTLRCGMVSARVISFGAALQSLIVPDRDGTLDDVVLGHDGPEGYLQHRKCFGATVGRVANRIADGRFTIDGTVHQVAVNEGTSTLHGGLTDLISGTGRWAQSLIIRFNSVCSVPTGTWAFREA